jgi:hypothetical protein
MAKKKLSSVSLPENLQTGFFKDLEQKIVAPSKPRISLPTLEWVNRYRRFDGMPPSIPFPIMDIYQDMHPEVVIMKAAQVYISEYGINLALWAADQHWADRGVCLYVFPKQEQMDDFSQDRVNRAIQGSFYLKERVLQVDRPEHANRVRLRKIGGSPIYFRGSDSVMQTRAIDADLVVCDEVDLFSEGAVQRVKERMGSSFQPLFRAFSQPQYPDGPIDKLYQESDQRHYYLTCEHCGEQQHLEWEHNIEFTLDRSDCRVICRKCKKHIDRLAKGEWRAHNPGAYAHGYHISKLYSPRANLQSILAKSLATHDPESIQSFYNADLGIVHRPEGSPGLESFHRGYWPWHAPLRENYMGIDPGKKIHVTVYGREYINQPLKLLHNESCDNWMEVEKIWWTFDPRLTITDGQGDMRATAEWADRHRGRVYKWFHRPSATEPKFSPTSHEVHYHRTSLLDNLYGVLKAHLAHLHVNAGEEFYSHLEANIREVLKNEKDGRLYIQYTPTKEDHYAFASAFAILAAGLRASDAKATVVPKVDPEEEELLVPGVTNRPGPQWTGFGAGVNRDGDGAAPSKWSRWRR